MQRPQYIINRSMPWDNIVEKPMLVSDEISRQSLSEVLSRGDNLYRIAFMPSVLAWVAFDYTQDVMYQAASLRLNFKRQNNKIRSLMDEFNAHYNHAPELNATNELNGIGLQEQYHQELKEMRDEITQHIHYCKPQLSGAMLMMYASVYVAMFAFRALFSYTFDCDMYLDSQIKNFGNRSILLSQPREIYKILPEYLGADKWLIRASDLDDYADRFSRYVQNSDFSNIQKPTIN